MWDLQRISAEMGQARLWCCTQRVCTSREGLWQPNPPCWWGFRERWDCFKCKPGFKGGIGYGSSLVPNLQSRMEEDSALFSSPDLKHVAEVSCTGRDFPLVGVHTNLAVSGYLHMLVCSHFILAFHRKAMGIFPSQQISKNIH